MTISQFKKAFEKIKKKGWLKSQRRGPTGIGHTLEQLLGLDENNIALPDLGKVELKAHRVNSSSMITLFTFNRKAWKMPPLEAIRNYGTVDDNGRLGLYFTMSLTPNSSGLFLHIDEDKISVRHTSGQVIAEWKLDNLAERFRQKIPALILVSAFSEMRGKTEWFKYTRAQLLTGTNSEIIKEQIECGNILVDLRLHDKGTRARNHGTGFRAYESKLPFLFKKVEEL
ncbi:hypothetical protein DRQ29_07665 [bacterium]|nr:MAG: hypothetical protein DRQ29_07665 [bacterium]